MLLKIHGIEFRVAGILRHIYRGNRVGIEFIELSERKKEQIDQLMIELLALCKNIERARAASRKLRDQYLYPE